MTKPFPFEFRLSATTMSDLFFNHRHEEYEQIYNRPINMKPPSAEQITLAIRADAQSFVDCFGSSEFSADEREAFVQWLVDDFQGRL